MQHSEAEFETAICCKNCAPGTAVPLVDVSDSIGLWRSDGHRRVDCDGCVQGAVGVIVVVIVVVVVGCGSGNGDIQSGGLVVSDRWIGGAFVVCWCGSRDVVRHQGVGIVSVRFGPHLQCRCVVKVHIFVSNNTGTIGIGVGRIDGVGVVKVLIFVSYGLIWTVLAA